MQTTIAEQRMLMFKEQLTFEKAQEVALAKKLDAFGSLTKLTSFLSKPKDEEFTLLYSEHRYEPFWHVKGQFKYEYDRTTTYNWPVSGVEVKKVTIEGKEYEVVDGKISIKGLDYCNEEDQPEVLVEGITGDRKNSLSDYFTYESNIINKDDLAKIDTSKIIVIPPTARVSALVNEMLASSVKAIQADNIYEESVEITNIDLYYRPVYAFQVNWATKAKDVVIQVDGLTGAVSFGTPLFKQYLGKALDRDFLFDVGADVAGMVLPGGSIAVKVAKKYMDNKKK